MLTNIYKNININVRTQHTGNYTHRQSNLWCVQIIVTLEDMHDMRWVMLGGR